MKAPILSALFAAATVTALILAGCSSPQPDQPSQQEAPQEEQATQSEVPSIPAEFKTRDYTGYPELDDILNAIAYETQQTTDGLQSQLDAFFANCGDSWEGYQAHEAELTEWYTTAIQASTDLYASMRTQMETYHQILLNNSEYSEYKVWNDVLSESYGVWDDALSDYYGDWDGMFSDIYRDCDDMISDGYDLVSYDEYQDTWSEFYDARQDAWEEMYELRQDAWDDLYKARQDTWDELYSRR